MKLGNRSAALLSKKVRGIKLISFKHRHVGDAWQGSCIILKPIFRFGVFACEYPITETILTFGAFDSP
jgi:hypothetical protein